MACGCRPPRSTWSTATDGQARPPARLIGWTARFLGMVRPGDEVDFRVDRVGIDQGAEVLEVAARIGSDLVMSATARLAAPKTVYAFPGQGIQHKGMGMDVRARSKAARKVWDNADKFTRDTLGFSVLHVVRDNPTSIIASGVHYHHPEGVLYLTQFTQVAMATVAAAQVAEMREQGAFVEGAIACGHSVGEYTALACVSGVYELEAMLETVFHRGSKMHDIVPRDELGRSNYRLAAIRPSQIDLARRRRSRIRRRDRRANRRIPGDRELQPAWLAVCDRRHRARSGGAGGRGRASP